MSHTEVENGKFCEKVYFIDIILIILKIILILNTLFKEKEILLNSEFFSTTGRAIVAFSI